VSGNEIVSKARSDAKLRDVSDAREIGAPEVSERIEETIDAAGEADTSQILTTIRNDTEVYLPPDDTEAAFHGAVNTLLSEEYKLKTGGEYVSSLGDRDPTAVVIVPMVPDDGGERIREYIDELEEKATFQVGDVQRECTPDHDEAAVQHFLLDNLGENDPHYVVGATGSEDPADWFPGAGFRIPPETGWTFEYPSEDSTEDSSAELRNEWNQKHESGTVGYGSISFTTDGDEGAPDSLREVATFQKAHTDLTLDPGQSHETVADVLENIPESAKDIDIHIQFE
jgi:hypothetical protein